MCSQTSSTVRRSTTSGRSPFVEPFCKIATISISTTTAATQSSRWKRGHTSMRVMRSSSPIAIRLVRASTWRRSLSTWGSSTMHPTPRTRKLARLERAGSAIGEWTLRTRRLLLWRGESCSARRPFSRSNDDKVLMRVVVVARAGVDLPTRMTAVDLDRRVTDLKLRAEPTLQVADDVLDIGQRRIAHHHVAAERDLFRGKGPHVQVVHARHKLGARDLLGHRSQVDLSRSAFHEQVDRLANDAPRAESDQDGNAQRQDRIDVEPAGEKDHDSGHDDADRRGKVTGHVHQRRPDVQAVSLSPEAEHYKQVDGDAD